jgi:hypothetical protein
MGVQKITCCIGCEAPARNATCHSYCQDYIEERKALDVDIAKRKRAKQAVNIFNGYAGDRYTQRIHRNNLRYGTLKKPTM